MPTKLPEIKIEGIGINLIHKTVLTYVAVIFMGMVFFIMFIPRLDSLKRIGREIEKQQTKRDDLRLSLSILDEFSSQVGRDGENLIFMTLPSEFDPGLVLADLRALSDEVGVVISSYSLTGGELSGEKTETDDNLGRGDVGTSLKRSSFSLGISGEPLALFAFIKALEENMPLVEMTDIQMSELSTAFFQTDKNLINMSLGLNYFYLPYETVDKYNSLSELIDETDMMVFEGLKRFRKPVYGVGVKGFEIPGGNQNLFGEPALE